MEKKIEKTELEQENEALKKKIQDLEARERERRAKEKLIQTHDLPREIRGGQPPRKPFVIVTTNDPVVKKGRG